MHKNKIEFHFLTMHMNNLDRALLMPHLVNMSIFLVYIHHIIMITISQVLSMPAFTNALKFSELFSEYLYFIALKFETRLKYIVSDLHINFLKF